MLYSIIPVAYPVESSPYVELLYANHHVLAYQTENGYVLERIFSTDPKDFSNPLLCPGSYLQNNLIQKMNK